MVRQTHMEKSCEIYRTNSDGGVEVARVKEKDTDGYVTGASKELVDAMLCEVKWEVKKLELEIKKVSWKMIFARFERCLEPLK